MAALKIGHRITGPLGVVKDTTFIRCFWPRLDRPTKLFADGSSGIKVLGSSRNVWFPDDTEWMDYHPDALYPAELAVKAVYPRLRGLVNLTDDQASIWMAAYEAAVATFPPTHAVHSSPRDVLFIRHSELISEPGKKARYQDYVSEVSTDLAGQIANGGKDANIEKLALDFRKVEDPHPSVDPTVTLYMVSIVDGKEVLAEKPPAVIEVQP